MFLFFFKQKTAYEMRISDWSSDVCSSDLSRRHQLSGNDHHAKGPPADRPSGLQRAGAIAGLSCSCHKRHRCRPATQSGEIGDGRVKNPMGPLGRNRNGTRSEEHTSELQSLMRISYAVFCLQKNITEIL